MQKEENLCLLQLIMLILEYKPSKTTTELKSMVD